MCFLANKQTYVLSSQQADVMCFLTNKQLTALPQMDYINNLCLQASKEIITNRRQGANRLHSLALQCAVSAHWTLRPVLNHGTKIHLQ
jgi:hypothetical protein